MSRRTFKYYLDRHNLDWECSFCALPKLNDSFFDDDLQRIQTPTRINRNVREAVEVVDENMLAQAENEIWADFDEITKNYGSNFKIAHINANSVGGFKFYEIKTWLHLYFYIFVLRSYCNAQLKIYIDNCAIEINKLLIIII